MVKMYMELVKISENDSKGNNNIIASMIWGICKVSH